MALKDDLSPRRGATLSVDSTDGKVKPLVKRRLAQPERPSLDVIEAKLQPPALRLGVVPRTALVNQLRRETATVVSIVARAGYGKTTLLAQWAPAETRGVAWV